MKTMNLEQMESLQGGFSYCNLAMGIAGGIWSTAFGMGFGPGIGFVVGLGWGLLQDELCKPRPGSIYPGRGYHN